MSKVYFISDCHFGHRNIGKYRTQFSSQEETIEQLEQLRWLKSGWKIGAQSVYFNGVEINSPEDVSVWHNKNSQ